MTLSNEWDNYEIIDASNGEKLEKWNNIILLRPDPQIIWGSTNLIDKYNDINAYYHRSIKGGGYWENIKRTPERWQVKYKNLTFNIKQMGFKHTGLFPEQSVNWDFMIEKIKKANKEVKVLNLFAYTGGASVACLSAGAQVTHVDSSKGMVEWAKENVASSNLEEKSIRYLVDDVVKFVKREIRRKNYYDAIVMDPPSYGKGSNGEIWDIEKDLYNLVELCMELFSEEPLFFIINSYTASLSKEVLENIIKLAINKNYTGKIYSDEIGLPIKDTNLILPCGIFARYEKNTN